MVKELQKPIHPIKSHAIGMVVLLTIEYLLGMYTNMFVKFPDNMSGGKAWVFAWGQIPLAVHIIVGFLLLFGMIVLVIRAILQKERTWIIASSIAAIAVFSAMATGSIFIPAQTDVYSYIMAVSFLIALISIFWGLYRSK